MRSTGSFEIRAFGSNFRLVAGDVEAYSILDRYVFPSLPRITADAVKPDLEIQMDQVAGQFHLSANGEAVASSGNANDLVRELIRVLDEAVIQRLTALWAVHAGAVMWHGRVMLFPGVTHAGKSSLVAELLRQGATYFSDEYALIDPEGFVHPYPRPLLVRNGGQTQVPLLAEECRATIGDRPAPAGWIFSLEYQPGGQWSIEPVPQSVALVTLLRNTPHALADSPEMAGAFQRAVSGTRCFAGSRNDAVDAASEILRLAGCDS